MQLIFTMSLQKTHFSIIILVAISSNCAKVMFKKCYILEGRNKKVPFFVIIRKYSHVFMTAGTLLNFVTNTMYSFHHLHF